MFKFILGFVVGANLSLFLYACLLNAKKADDEMNYRGGKDE